MTRAVQRAALALCFGLLSSGAALAQAEVSQTPGIIAPDTSDTAAPGRCPEGRMADGRCANPILALSGRDRGIIFSQPRLSFLAPVRTLPSGPRANDRIFRSPNNPITDSDREIDLLLGRARIR